MSRAAATAGQGTESARGLLGVAMPVLDHVADAATGGGELFRLTQLYGDAVLGVVKSARFADTMQPGRLPVSVYADQVGKNFPLHNAASTFLSYVFYTEKKAEFNESSRARIEQQLHRYVHYWGIKAAVDRFRGRHDELHKQADAGRPDGDFAWVWVDEESGAKQRRLPLKNAAEVKAAADWLGQYYDRIPWRDRTRIAGRILQKAAHFGAAVGDKRDFLERQAGHGVCDPAAVVALLEGRARLAF